MDKQKFLELIEKQAQGRTTPEEDQLIFDVYDRMQEKELPIITNESEEIDIKNRIKESIERRISRDIAKPTVKFIPWVLRTAAAVSILIALTFSIVYFTQQEKTVQMLSRSTNQEQKATITLTDGTKVHLNVLSSISFPEQFDKNNRSVVVQGEAFFEVTPDKKRPFIVEANGVKTKVLGTSFNINSYNGDDVIVAVKTGKVEVSAPEDNSNKVVLLPNQKATFERSSKNLLVEEVDMDYYLDWRNKTITFNLNSMEEVVTRLSRVYNMKIDLKGYQGNDCLIKASYPNDNLYSVLYGLQNLVDFEYTWKGEKTLEIIYKGCKN